MSSVFKIALCENVELRSEVEPDKSKTTVDIQFYDNDRVHSLQHEQ